MSFPAPRIQRNAVILHTPDLRQSLIKDPLLGGAVVEKCHELRQSVLFKHGVMCSISDRSFVSVHRGATESDTLPGMLLVQHQMF